MAPRVWAAGQLRWVLRECERRDEDDEQRGWQLSAVNSHGCGPSVKWMLQRITVEAMVRGAARIA